MHSKAKFSRDVDRNEVVLCKTTNNRIGLKTSTLLLEESIPFTKEWERVPFFQRDKYKGASEVCVIRISRHEYYRARKALDKMERFEYKRLLMNVI